MHIKQNRRCVACRECVQQSELLRVGRINNEFVIDSSHKLGGRGAYVCNKNDCINLTMKKKLLNRSFKTNLDVKIYEKLGEYVQNN